jgi:hypothetical protein
MTLSAVIKSVVIPMLAVGLLAQGSGEVEFVTEELPWAVIDQAYSPAPFDVRVSGKCPAGGVGFSVVSGTLPPGLKLSRLGYFSGVPTRTGQFEFNVRAVNGCSWTARHFALLVTNPPKLYAKPDVLTVTSPSGVDPPPLAIHMTATWPKLAYQVNVAYRNGEAGNWLVISPEHGMTARESVPRRLAEVPGDDISVTVRTKGLRAGQYTGQISISAWEALPIIVAVSLTVGEDVSASAAH